MMEGGLIRYEALVDKKREERRGENKEKETENHMREKLNRM